MDGLRDVNMFMRESEKKMPDPKRSFYGSFKTRPLPKQEYLLFKALQDAYEINDPADLITLMTRLVYEMHHHPQGSGWWANVIETWRDNPDEARTYDLT